MPEQVDLTAPLRVDLSRGPRAIMTTNCPDLSHSRLRPAVRRNLQRLLAPQRMAFIGGAQAERTLATLRQQAFEGTVDVVHPRRDKMEGYPCVQRIADLPAPPDAVFLPVNADATIDAPDALRERGARGGTRWRAIRGGRGLPIRRRRTRRCSAPATPTPRSAR